MANNPIQNPGTPPIQPTPGEKPRIGEMEDPSQRPFSLPPEAGKQTGSAEAPTSKPTPMELARESAQQQQQMSPEDIASQMDQLKNKLGDVRDKLQNPSITNKFVPDHYEALNKVAEKMNPDLNTIAKNTNGEFNPPPKAPGEGVLSYITKWIDGSQQTLTDAVNYLSTGKQAVNPAAMMKVQYAVQRAVQRGEVFSSIVGASVSGIKTLMSTQIG